MDFGSGIGNSILYFREFFSQSKLTCADVSTKSIEISKKRFPGDEEYIEITNKIPVKDEGYDAVFTACVFIIYRMRSMKNGWKSFGGC